MLFTYEAYETLIDLLRKHGYTVSSYRNWQMATRCVILRHDIDYDPAKAIEMAKLEQRLGVQSTYFALLTSDFYNAFSKESGEMFREISACGHEIGLHFDEVRYPELAGDADAVREKIIQECRLLEAAAGREITIVSMHRPSKAILEADLEIPGIINSYGSVYFKGFKYLSDSRRRWREPVEDIISSKQYDRLHILTHAFWYNETETDLHDALLSFIKAGNGDRYTLLNENFTMLSDVVRPDEAAGGVPA